MTTFLIDQGSFRHICFNRIAHRHFPEVRGEGASLASATVDLIRELTRARDHACDLADREALDRAIADARRFQEGRAGERAGAFAAAHAAPRGGSRRAPYPA